MKIFVAIPAYDSTISIETARALLNEQAVFSLAGHDLTVAFVPGCSLITMARNQLVADFLKSDCDRLVFVDSDVSWQLGSLLRVAMHPVGVVGGAYRYKKALEDYPVLWNSDPELWAVDGLLKVDGLPGGFLSISRDALETFRTFHGDRGYEHQGHSAYAYFTAPFRDGRLYGEDNAFCADYREAGGSVWLDPELTLTHHAPGQAYEGNIGQWLRSRMKEAA